MNDIQKFTNDEFGTIRVADNNGEPWFVAKDVCDALGIATNHVKDGLDSDEVRNLPITEIGPKKGGKAPLIVSEPGFYKLVMKSRKPEAKAFQRWVTHEVLPSIRKQGGYMPARADETPEQIMARALMLAKDTMDRQQREIAELRPKALFADAVAASDGTCLIGELAKMMRQNGVHVGQNRLFEWLRRDGFLGKTGSNYNVPTQMAMERGLFRIKETAVTHSDGHVTVNRTPKATGRGQRYFIDRYCKA
ncbi:Phage antirepressor protein KilAC domain protein [Collinsella intestinalis]|uniref:Phage antirepressor protein KilAC domain protein n=1 Tax=Collinsella intestinalis TaxID=147207 RepID=A0A5K1ISE4_9ACTN|nr:phage antirepressor KilAC domain-containing protein [Collinsella intestinalis]VWL91530.1 Phage antirepressor protein KilAC domain protein [Collinsella intestinalis]